MDTYLSDVLAIQSLQSCGEVDGGGGAQPCLPGVAPPPNKHPALLRYHHGVLPATCHLPHHIS